MVFANERGKAAPKHELTYPVGKLGRVLNALGSGIMKRNIFKKLGISEKKWGLSLLLAGFAALNVGFTNQVNEIEATKVAQVEESTVSMADFSAINDTNAIELNEYVDSTSAAEVAVNLPPTNGEGTWQPLYYDGDYADVLTMEATAYLPTDGDGYGITATGIPATYGVAAVDPYVIPLGTRLYIPGYGEAIAADTGGAIIGYRIDLCMESYDECMQFGRRNVTVYILR